MKSPPNHKSNVWLTSKLQRDTKLKEQLLEGRRRKREREHEIVALNVPWP